MRSEKRAEAETEAVGEVSRSGVVVQVLRHGETLKFYSSTLNCPSSLVSYG